MTNELIEDLASKERDIIDLIDFLRIRYPEILKEYEEKKISGMIYE